MNKDYCFSIDWLTVDVMCDDLSSFLSFFERFIPGINEWTDCKPKRFYDYALNLNLKNIISIEYSIDPDTNMVDLRPGVNHGILVNISGDGLRLMGNNNVCKFIVECMDNWSCHWTRVDLALDIYNKDNPIVPLLLESVRNRMNNSLGVPRLVSRSREMKIFNNYDRFNKRISESATIGKRGNNYVRIYDKSLEQREQNYNKGRADNIPDYWYRIEIECRRTSRFEYGDSVINAYLSGTALNDIFSSQLQRVFRVDDVRYEGTSNGSEINVIWSQFLFDISQNPNFVQLVYLEYVGCVVDVERNFDRYSSMFFTALQCLPSDFILDLYNRYMARIPNDPKLSRYRKMIYDSLGDSHDFSLDDVLQKLLLH